MKQKQHLNEKNISKDIKRNYELMQPHKQLLNNLPINENNIKSKINVISNLQIKVYDDKLVMYNGATLSQEVPIERFDKPHQSKPFNSTIASVFYKAGFIENWGKGTLNIINECVEYGLPKPTFEYEWTAVRTTFYKAQETPKKIQKKGYWHC